MSFEQACQELHHRCEAIRADEMLDFNVVNPHKALLSTTGKKKGKTGQSELANCLAKDCSSMIALSTVHRRKDSLGGVKGWPGQSKLQCSNPSN